MHQAPTLAPDQEVGHQTAAVLHQHEWIIRPAVLLLLARELEQLKHGQRPRGRARFHPLRTARYLGMVAGTGTAVAIAVHRLRVAKQDEDGTAA